MWSPLAATALGAALLLLAWWLPRRVAGTRWRWNLALAWDFLLPAWIFAFVCLLSVRPLFAGVVTASLGAGYAYADRAKRRTLDEPIVFTDVFQVFDILRHPKLALPFPNKPAVLIGATGVIALYALLYLLERPMAARTTLHALGLLALLGGAVWAWTSSQLSARLAGPLRKLHPSGDPVQDAAGLGPLGMHFVHGMVARGEREQRRAGVPYLSLPRGFSASGPVVVVQSESFFDARRLHPSITDELVPNFARACAGGAQWGRLQVPSWGANTVRTEFSVLTGLAPADIGFDHFNPYRRFADAPVPSLASRLREQGYRAICLHPFDGRFYRRDRVMPNLGFDELLTEQAFPADAERVEGYISDAEVARKAVELIERRGPRVFLFIVTMENHGPWAASVESGNQFAAGLALPPGERGLLGRYLSSLRNADAMLGTLGGALARVPGGGTLAFYGDHLPAFGACFARLGLRDRRSDYLVWRSNADRGPSKQIDLAAQDLAAAVLRV